jgi:hypothetical protein
MKESEKLRQEALNADPEENDWIYWNRQKKIRRA